jgi:peptidyl-prolyl cis-trans isomerase C
MKITLIALLFISLVACNQQQEQQLPESDVIAVVGDEAVTADLLKAFLNANGIANPTDETIGKAMDALVNEVAMANIAKKKQLPLSKEQLYTLQYLQIKAMANTAKQDYLLDNPVTEAEINNEYTKANQQTKGQEFHLHHLLYKDEVQAIKVLEKLQSVDDYLALEQTFRQNNPNMKNVGDLGWIILGQLPKSFGEILPTLQENTLYKDVLNSKFGAHIVYLEKVRQLQSPKLEDVKEGITKSLQNKKISKFIQLAKAKAHVIIRE